MNGYCIYLTAFKAEVAECAFNLVSFYLRKLDEFTHDLLPITPFC